MEKPEGHPAIGGNKKVTRLMKPVAGKDPKAVKEKKEATPKRPTREVVEEQVRAKGPWTFIRQDHREFVAFNGMPGKHPMVFRNAAGENIECGETTARKVLGFTKPKLDKKRSVESMTEKVEALSKEGPTAS